MKKYLLYTIILCTYLASSLQAQSLTNDSVCFVHYINVGQGDATLLQFKCGAILIDAGAQDQEHVNKMITYIQGVFDDNLNLNNTLDAIIITHDHPDHTKGLKELMQEFTVNKIIYNGIEGSRGDLPWALNNPDEHQTEIISVTYEMVIAGDNINGLTNDDIDPIACPIVDPVITILSGGFQSNPGWTHAEYDNDNNHSLLVRMDFMDASFLFTGDLEEDALDTIIYYYVKGGAADVFDVDVLHVGHHGSYNATTEELLAVVSPEMAIIPVGEWTYGQDTEYKFTTYNYGHPRKSTIKLLEKYIPNNKKRSQKITPKLAKAPRNYRGKTIKEKIYATGWDGNIRVRAKADGHFIVNTNLP